MDHVLSLEGAYFAILSIHIKGKHQGSGKMKNLVDTIANKG